MKEEEMEKLEILKIASPPSSYSDIEADAWYKGLCFGIDRVVEKLKKSIS